MSPADDGWPFASMQGGPFGWLVFDRAGNLYGTTYNGCCGNGGTVFDLTPSNGGWIYHLLHSFILPFAVHGIYYLGGPASSLTLDFAGNTYGTAYLDGLYGLGSVFKLTRAGAENQNAPPWRKCERVGQHFL